MGTPSSLESASQVPTSPLLTFSRWVLPLELWRYWFGVAQWRRIPETGWFGIAVCDLQTKCNELLNMGGKVQLDTSVHWGVQRDFFLPCSVIRYIWSVCHKQLFQTNLFRLQEHSFEWARSKRLWDCTVQVKVITWRAHLSGYRAPMKVITRSLFQEYQFICLH